jgi:hypothetical protein
VNRRTALVIAGSAPLLAACLYDQYFDIEWDEEVLLHDGRVILVHVKNTYERRGQGLTQYDETKITFRRKELTFESELGKLVTFKTRMPVAYLGQFGTNWYAVISGQGPYGNYPDEMPDHWGNDYSPSIRRLAILQDGLFVPTRWATAPDPLNTEKWRPNLMRTSFWSDFPEWNGKRLTLNQKKVFNEAHP